RPPGSINYADAAPPRRLPLCREPSWAPMNSPEQVASRPRPERRKNARTTIRTNDPARATPKARRARADLLLPPSERLHPRGGRRACTPVATAAELIAPLATRAIADPGRQRPANSRGADGRYDGST